MCKELDETKKEEDVCKEILKGMYEHNIELVSWNRKVMIMAMLVFAITNIAMIVFNFILVTTK